MGRRSGHKWGSDFCANFATNFRRVVIYIISNLETSSSLENAYPPPFLKERFSNLIAKIRKML